MALRSFPPRGFPHAETVRPAFPLPRRFTCSDRRWRLCPQSRVVVDLEVVRPAGRLLFPIEGLGTTIPDRPRSGEVS